MNEGENMNLIDRIKNTISKSKKSKIITLLIVIGILSMGTISYIKAQNAKVKEVTLTTVSKGTLTQSVAITGNVTANSRNEIALSPASKVIEVLVKKGQTVNKDDVLAKLDDSEYKSQLLKQSINLSNAESTLTYITGSSSSVDKSASENSVSQAEITLENAKANYEDVNKKFEQNKILYDHGYISTNEFDASKKAVSDCSNAVSSAQIALSNAKNTFSNINVATGEKVSNQKTQIALINADIKYLNEKIESCNLRAGIGGKVTKMDAAQGQYPTAGDVIIVDETSSYAVDLKVSQYDSVNIKTEQKVKIKVKGVDKEYSGAVSEIGELAEKTIASTDQDSKVNIKVTISDPDEKIKVGYEADADIILNEKQNVLQVSFEAVQDEKSTGKKYVYVVGSNKKTEKRYIKTGLDTDYYIEVLSGLKEGEKCVSNPDKTLVEGDTIKEAGGSK